MKVYLRRKKTNNYFPICRDEYREACYFLATKTSRCCNDKFLCEGPYVYIRISKKEYEELKNDKQCNNDWKINKRP
jgi:hypothetical protein